MFKSKAEAIVQITWCDLERHDHKLISMATYQVAKQMHKNFIVRMIHMLRLKTTPHVPQNRHASANQSNVSRQTYQQVN